ncbi:MAG: FAD-binding oxidoreductase [Pseudomonadota bacterium]
MNHITAFPCNDARPLPKRTDILIIGAGVIGVSAALALAEAGHNLVLCEKGRIAAEQSSRNWGWIRAQGRDLRELPLALESQALWRRWAPRLDCDIGLRQGGVTYLATSDAEMARYRAWLELARPFQLGTVALSAQDADRLTGRSGRLFKGGIHTPSDMHAEPGLSVPALARRAASLGATLFEAMAVRKLDIAGGRVVGAVTEHGRIAAQAVILAGGAWSRSFLENHGRGLAQLTVRSQCLRTEPAPAIAPGAIGAASIAAIRPRLDGGYAIGKSGAARVDLIPAAFAHFHRFLPIVRDRWKILKIRMGSEFFGALGRHRWGAEQLSPMETARILDPSPDPGILRDAMAGARHMFPQLAKVRIAESWGGMIDVTPDEIPVIGSVRGLPGLTLATGFSGHGFGIGPGAGSLAAQLATGAVPLVDPAAFAPARLNA